LKGRTLPLLRRLVDVREGELAALVWSSGCGGLMLAAYYILRPLREEMGVAGGVKNLPWMFTGTLLATLAASPLFSLLVSRTPRRRFIPIAHHFFAFNLLVFFMLFHLLSAESGAYVARAFFIWTSVFNLFVVSIFWGYMADLFRSEQGKRLFGFISAGGTLGAVGGSFLTTTIVHAVGTVQLLLIAAVVLEIGVVALHRLEALSGALSWSAAPATAAATATQDAPGEFSRTGIWGGLTLVLRSPYLLLICLYMLLFTTTSTFAYLEQARIVQASAVSPEARTAIFARIDFLVNLVSIVAQMFLTGRIIKAIGLGATQSILPTISLAGFGALMAYPQLGVLMTFQVLRRSGDYAAAKPAREVLYTVVRREEKYKAKSFIDTFVYRGGDAIGAWIYRLLTLSGDPATRVAMASLPITVAWVGVCLVLGRWQRSRAAAGF